VTGGEDAKINVWSGLGDLDGDTMDTDIIFSPGPRKRDMDWEAEQVRAVDKCREHMSLT